MTKIKYLAFFLVLVLMIFLNFCEKEAESNNFKIFFLSDTSVTYTEAEQITLSKLKLENKPVITTDDILEYQIDYIPDNPIRGHSMLLNESVPEKLGEIIRPFVATVNGERIYLGEYWQQMMSYFPRPILMIRYSGNRYHLLPHSEVGNELLNDSRIIDALENAGIEIIYKDISD